MSLAQVCSNEFVIVELLFMGAHVVSAEPAQDAAAAQEHADRGRQLIGRGELAPAERDLRQAVELAPGSPEFLGLLGVQHKLQESDVYLEKALRFGPADSATRRNLAWNQLNSASWLRRKSTSNAS